MNRLLIFCFLVSTCLAEENPVYQGSNWKPPSLEIVIDSFGNCDQSKSLPNNLVNTVLSYNPHTEIFYMTLKLNITETIQNNVKIVWQTDRCLNQEENTCLRFIKYTIPDFCGDIINPIWPWTTFIKKMPGLNNTCPILPGLYDMDPAFVDVPHIVQYPKHGYFRSYMRWTQDGKELMCTAKVFELRQKRKKRKPKPETL